MAPQGDRQRWTEAGASGERETRYPAELGLETRKWCNLGAMGERFKNGALVTN